MVVSLLIGQGRRHLQDHISSYHPLVAVRLSRDEHTSVTTTPVTPSGIDGYYHWDQILHLDDVLLPYYWVTLEIVAYDSMRVLGKGKVKVVGYEEEYCVEVPPWGYITILNHTMEEESCVTRRDDSYKLVHKVTMDSRIVPVYSNTRMHYKTRSTVQVVNLLSQLIDELTRVHNEIITTALMVRRSSEEQPSSGIRVREDEMTSSLPPTPPLLNVTLLQKHPPPDSSSISDGLYIRFEVLDNHDRVITAANLSYSGQTVVLSLPCTYDAYRCWVRFGIAVGHTLMDSCGAPMDLNRIFLQGSGIVRFATSSYFVKLKVVMMIIP